VNSCFHKLIGYRVNWQPSDFSKIGFEPPRSSVTDVYPACSIDGNIWPNVLDYQLDNGLKVDLDDVGELDYLSTFIGNIQDFDFARGLADKASLTGEFIIVGLSMHYSNVEDCLDHDFVDIVAACPDVSLLEGWDCIGYDVANTSYLSALHNFDYDFSQTGAWLKKYTSNLNQVGLFEDLEIAGRVALEASDVLKHGDFFAYGIFIKHGSKVKY